MKKLLLSALLALGAFVAPASAQQQPLQALIVPSCGSQSLTAAAYGYLTMDATGKLCDGSSGGGTSTTQITVGGVAVPWTGLTAGGINYGLVGVVDSTGTQLNGYTAGTAGTPSTQVLSVQGVSGGTPVAVNQNPSSSTAAAMSHASTTALGTFLVAKASAGNLYGFNCAAIAGGSGGNCIAYNGTTAPGTGALTGANVLDFCTFDTGTKGCSLSRIPLPVNYGTGIVILISSAASPYTYTTGTDTGAITVDYQ